MAGWTSEDFCSLFVKFKISKGLFFKTCCMQCVLNSKIQHKIFNHLIIGIIKKLFDDERTNNTASKPFRLVFTAKYMNFSRYYRGAFDPNIIISIKIKGVSQITNDFAVLFYEMEYTGFEPVAFTMRM